jgi:peptidyl-prolyl cis-trans isomerase C
MMNGEVTTSFITSELAYLVLRNSFNRYHKSPTELSTNQLAELAAQARTRYELETQVLASPEAKEVVVAHSQVESALAEIQSYYSDEDAFQQDLINNGINSDSLQQCLYRELTVESVLDKIGAQATTQLNEVDAKIYYYMHLEQFYQPETRTVRHILMTTAVDSPNKTRRAVRTRLKHIAARLHHKPNRFAAQAEKYSECTTAAQGGLIGRVPRGQLYSTLDEVLFTLEVNQISKPVESPLGFHLLLCEAIHPPGIIDFEEAQPRILEILTKRYRHLRQKNWLAQFQAIPTSSEELIASLMDSK